MLPEEEKCLNPCWWQWLLLTLSSGKQAQGSESQVQEAAVRVRKGPGKGVFERDSELTGGAWVKKYSAVIFPVIFPNNTNLKSFLCRKDETGFTDSQEYQWWALVMGSAQIKLAS